MYDDDENNGYEYDAYDYYMHTGELPEEFEDVPIDDFVDDDYNDLNECRDDDANALELPDESDGDIMSTEDMMHAGMLHQLQEKEALNKKKANRLDGATAGCFIILVLFIIFLLICVLT